MEAHQLLSCNFWVKIRVFGNHAETVRDRGHMGVPKLSAHRALSDGPDFTPSRVARVARVAKNLAKLAIFSIFRRFYPIRAYLKIPPFPDAG